MKFGGLLGTGLLGGRSRRCCRPCTLPSWWGHFPRGTRPWYTQAGQRSCSRSPRRNFQFDIRPLGTQPCTWRRCPSSLGPHLIGTIRLCRLAEGCKCSPCRRCRRCLGGGQRIRMRQTACLRVFHHRSVHFAAVPVLVTALPKHTVAKHKVRGSAFVLFVIHVHAAKVFGSGIN